MQLDQSEKQIFNRQNIGLLLSWVLLGITFLYLIFVVAPGRGANWNSDDGYVLLNAWNLSENWIFSKSFPQQPMYIFQALMMKIGITDYLTFRYLYYFLTLIGSILFYSGIDKRGVKSPFVTAASIATLAISFTSISYFFQFFLIGMGLYFYSKKFKGRLTTPLLLIFSAIFICLQGLSAGIAIGMVVLVIFMIIVDSDLRNSIFPIVFFIGITSIWGIYAYLIGLNNLLTVPPGHTAEVTYFLSRMVQIMNQYIFGMIFCIIAYIGLNFFKKIQPIHIYIFTSTIITIIFILEVIKNISESNISYYFRLFFPEYLFDIYKNKLGINNLILMQTPMFAFYFLLNSFFFFLCTNVISTYKFKNFRSFIVDFNEKGDLPLIFGVMGYLLLFSSYTTGSNVFFHTLLGAFGGVFLGIAIICIGNVLILCTNYFVKSILFSIVTIWTFIFLMLGVKYNIPTLQPILNFSEKKILDGPLAGIKERSLGLKALSDVNETYKNYGCENKILITLEYIPLLNFSLQNKHSENVPFVRPSHLFPGNAIDKIVLENNSWCVIDVSSKETLEYIKASNNIDQRDLSREKIIKSMVRSTKIAGPSEDIQEITIYTK
jgi:hypothetical protein